MPYYTHVNRGKIDGNRKRGTNEPVVSVRRGKHGKAAYGNEIILPPGSRVIYSPHVPILPCGARLVIVSEEKPEIVG